MDYYDSDYSQAYDDDDEYSGMVSSSDDGDLGLEDDAGIASTSRQVKFSVMDENELKNRRQESIKSVIDVLSITEDEAAKVLRLYKWDSNRVNEEWFNDTEAVREKAGISGEEASTSGGKVQCQICFESYNKPDMCCAPCQHFFCKDCWQGYVSAAIQGGPSCLNLRCPLPQCSAAVPISIVCEVASERERQKYDRFAVRSFVEDNPKMTWCPNRGCENAVECLGDVVNEPQDVACKCGYSFCFTCKEEAHRPVDCETVRRWLIKNSAESENLNWILANTKPCPKCKRPIEKHQGCMHMTCSQCKHEFCWLCLGTWSEHGERTGGFYACNRYEAAKKRGEYDDEIQKREHAKNSLERYMHYYQRWHENDKARQLAYNKMRSLSEEHMNDKSKLEQLSEITATPTSQLKFVTDAWLQVVECRRILKWTYAYGYYTFADESSDKHSQQDFFEFSQAQAECYIEKLHGLAEKDLDSYIKRDNKEPWGSFRQNLIGVTDVTRQHFEKLVSQLEKGLSELSSEYQGANTEGTDVAGPSSSGDDKNNTKGKGRGAKRTRALHGKVGAGELEAAEELAGHWQCHACTYANSNLAATRCEMCERPRADN